MSRHVIVIGAGIGGLSAALQLIARGYRVTLCERATEPGGKMREIHPASSGIDSGPTVFTMRWVFDELFGRLDESLESRVELLRADNLARHSWPDGSQLDLYADLEKSIAAIDALAGRSEADAYRAFAARSARVFETLDDSFMQAAKPGMLSLTMRVGIHRIARLMETQPFRSLWNELGGVFSDPRLRQLFGRYSTYCGSSPFESPATLMLIAHAEREGVWYVKGGMQRFAELLRDLLAERGADLRFGNGVDEILLNEGAATGVKLDNGEAITADAIVYNGDVNALGHGLLGGGVSNALPDRRDEQRSLSAVTWSMEGRVTGFPLDYHTVFFGSDYPAEFSSIFEQRQVCREPTVYICAQDRWAGKPDGDVERLFLLVNAPPRTITDDEADRIQEDAFKLLAMQGLEIDVSACTRTLPQDFAERFPGSDGAIYGWPTHGWSGSFRRAGSTGRVPRLYFAGGTVHPGPGIPMTALSGRLAAERIHRDLPASG